MIAHGGKENKRYDEALLIKNRLESLGFKILSQELPINRDNNNKLLYRLMPSKIIKTIFENLKDIVVLFPENSSRRRSTNAIRICSNLDSVIFT